MHTPVLLAETLSLLNPKPGQFVIDGTLGGGGHATAMLDRMMPEGTFLGIDWDEESLTRARFAIEVRYRAHARTFRFEWACDTFANLPAILAAHQLGSADGLLLDLGFSSDQIESTYAARGFSFLRNEPLLMTYRDAEVPVKELLRRMDAAELARIIREFGEERYALRIAEAIVAREQERPLEMTGELAEIIARAVPKNYERGRIHPATRTFLALRIYANHELDHLRTALEHLAEIVAPQGRIAIITFHSLEDRIVKNAFRDLARRDRTRSLGVVLKKVGVATVLTKKPITPSPEEVAANSRARSAKLRAVAIS